MSDSADPLVAAALAARDRAYAPYSNFHVGCAVESEDGEVAVGANMENACYRLGVCAEQSALTAAQNAFGLGKIRRLAIVGGPSDSDAAEVGAIMPCGGCRQAILEAALLADRDIEITCCDRHGRERVDTTIRALLPASFTFSKT